MSRAIERGKFRFKAICIYCQKEFRTERKVALYCSDICNVRDWNEKVARERRRVAELEAVHS